jgi:hypothetical protein
VKRLDVVEFLHIKYRHGEANVETESINTFKHKYGIKSVSFDLSAVRETKLLASKCRQQGR